MNFTLYNNLHSALTVNESATVSNIKLCNTSDLG